MNAYIKEITHLLWHLGDHHVRIFTYHSTEEIAQSATVTINDNNFMSLQAKLIRLVSCVYSVAIILNGVLNVVGQFC